ncbi:putative ABC transporter B family member 8 [Prosopis cineraria]|uniref:putative ABC transporter B family member 8 n=1 Tax=Prosopis cineraria TaxID=364024 RepID=UPI00240F4F0D|nr:putative ABC transporter B family member 8 [Prosopis cineraria]
MGSSERQVLEKGGKDQRSSNNSLAIIFRYSDWIDVVLMVVGALGAIGDGMSTNVLLIFVSRIMNSLGYGNKHQNSGNFMAEVEKCSLYFVYLGLAAMVVAFMEGYCWSKTGERQVLRIRYKYLEAVLRQEVGLFDSQEATTSEIINSISKDTSLIQEVLSEKVPLFFMHSSSFISGVAFSAYFCWRVTLAAFPTLLLLIIPGMLYGKFLIYLSKKSYKEYGKANSIVEQALSSIKTIYSFTAEKRIIQKYSAILDKTSELGIKHGLAKGLAVGSMGLSFAIWAFLSWHGSRLVMYSGESGGRVYAASITFIMAGLSLGVVLPDLKYFTEASVAASRIFDVIDRIPSIDAEDTRGLALERMSGKLEFEHVKFTYPSRPETVVLRDFNLRVEAGKTVALVGASGSGKSTAIALLQRFYDANEGVVRIDGEDIRSLQLKWIRGKMGLVSQEHALFGTSIKENIMFGKPDATMDEVIAATTAANAHDFIRQLPEGYETKIGEKGALLSGGQKQRVAIARAIIKNPVILLLDEATSALDSESESLVQTALDQASMGRTTLVVAHKLSTIRTADLIAVVNGGCVNETGTHNELINRPNGLYAKLAKLQRQLSCDVQEQNPEMGISSVTRSSAGRPSTARSSPVIFLKSPMPDDAPSNPVSYPPPSFYRLLSLNASEWKQGLIGTLSAIASGSVQPIYAFTVGGVISAFYIESHEEMRQKIRTYCFIFSILALASIVVNLIQHYNFAHMGEKLTKRVRLRMLEKILTFETAWFEEEQNSSGALCSRLSNEASMVKSLVADRVSLLVQTTSAVTIAMIIGLVVAWKLALVMIAVQPLTIICFYTRKVLLSALSTKFIKAQNQSTQIAVEAVYNHRIVTSFESTRLVLKLFDKAQEAPRKEARKKSWLAGIGMGSAQCLTFMSWALDFWFGGTLVKNSEISAGAVFKTFFVLVSTGKVIADAGSMTSDLAKTSTAVASVFEILDRKSLIPKAGDGASGCKLEKMGGNIMMKNVDFAYPTRREAPILRQFCLEVKAGTSIGLVGKSGCGKSTVIALIQRFYEAERGYIKVDGVDIRELDVHWYRQHTALVSQEPVIYSGTVRDNILFGKQNATENEVVEAAMAANAHEFISSLKDGYETECGERGVQFSGGQKQRIAIARAIIRSPTILLLDEATSALDVQSEQIVQEALDRIMVGRTTIVVAHRLNTIKNLDSIAYLADGKVIERGTYARLRHMKGAFFNLSTHQT